MTVPFSSPLSEATAQVWSDVESFLRDPKPVLEQLHARLEADSKGSDKTRDLVRRLEALLAQKANERTRVVGLFRRGRLGEAALDAQMDEIGKEEAALEAQVGELRGKLGVGGTAEAAVSSAQALLTKLRKRLREPLSWELKRHLVEVLVSGLRVETFELNGVKQARIVSTYRFGEPDQASLVMPRTYSSIPVRDVAEPRTIGDHIRRRRIGLKMLQRQVAEKIGVDPTSVFNWEANTATPRARFMLAIARFLGYEPSVS